VKVPPHLERSVKFGDLPRTFALGSLGGIRRSAGKPRSADFIEAYAPFPRGRQRTTCRVGFFRATYVRVVHAARRPQQCLYFFPLPHGQRSFRPIFLVAAFAAAGRGCPAAVFSMTTEMPPMITPA
jgi:hypothetical protein